MKIMTFCVFKSLSENALSYSYVEITAIIRIKRSNRRSPTVIVFKNTPANASAVRKYFNRKKPTVTITMPVPVIILFNIFSILQSFDRKTTTQFANFNPLFLINLYTVMRFYAPKAFERVFFTRRRIFSFCENTSQKPFSALLYENRAITRP